MDTIAFSAHKKTQWYAKTNKQTMNLSEVRMWMILKSSSYKFRRQQTIGNFIVDFASLSHKIIIEIDGISHEEKAPYDARRDDFILSHGHRLLRFVWMIPYPDSEVSEFVWNKIQELELWKERLMTVDI